MVHEIAHRFFCDLAKVPVHEVSYFRLGNPAGYVVHSKVSGLKKSLLISIGPLFVNTTLCSLLTFAAVYPLYTLRIQEGSGIFVFLMWVGVSIGMHAFPSNEDIQNFLLEVKEAKEGGLLHLVAQVFAIIVRLSNVLRVLWFDLIYAVFISMLLPLFLLNL